ncbi:DUF2909 domain-containing protein [Pseudoalteromonas luteoviolacea]|uniref:DUF2909 domain-containing protein n=1 Tax=Pseudoalteromonas luteoviolacea TaxID=43657 RepID=UPI0009BDC114|nr:DUF2909 domain-containing protein [Pseudoalteromonas luteoviolacea]MBQ4907328.1 DUF2909 domain-containing protein [Pseudoalteromonas luteoviolacea]
MLIKWIITALLLVILYHLFYALFVMLQGAEKSKNMSQILGKRVIFSLLVMLCITLSSQMGLFNFNPQPSAKSHTQTQTNIAKQHQQNANTKQQPETQNVD